MKTVSLILASLLSYSALHSHEEYKLGFEHVNSKNELIPSISLKVGSISSDDVDFMFAYASNAYAKKTPLSATDKIENISIALNYRF